MLRRRNKVLKYKINKFKRRFSFFFSKHKKLVIFLIVIFAFLFILKLEYLKYIDNPKNLITEVYFNKKIISNPNFSGLCNYVSKCFSGVNSVKNKFFWYKKEINLIKSKYKYIKNIKVELMNNQSIKVNFYFKKPKLTIFWSGYAFNVYSKSNIYSLNKKYLSWINLLSTWNKLYLPSYLAWLKNINDIFWKNSPDKIIEYYKKIKTIYPKSKIFYLAWWEDLLVFISNKKIIFSLSKGIDEQISQLKLLIRKMPDKYNLAKNIDVWNLDKGIFLDVYDKK